MSYIKTSLVIFYLLSSFAVAANDVYNDNASGFASEVKKTAPIHVLSDDPNYRRKSTTQTLVKEQKAPLPAVLTEPRIIRFENPVSSIQSTNNSQLFIFQDITIRADETPRDVGFIPMELRKSQIEALTKAATRKHK